MRWLLRWCVPDRALEWRSLTYWTVDELLYAWQHGMAE